MFGLSYISVGLRSGVDLANNLKVLTDFIRGSYMAPNSSNNGR